MNESNGTGVQRVVFILGIEQRSGTNFLSDLLKEHPDCQRVQTIWEDHFIENSQHLHHFVSAVRKKWKAEWDSDGSLEAALGQSLGHACVSFLSMVTEKALGETLPTYIVSKTPSVKNLTFLRYFPGSKAIVLVRDGRSVVESGLRSFGGTFDDWAMRWADGARCIAAAQSTGSDLLVVRYEDLVERNRGELARIFNYLEIDPGSYDYEAAENLPVRGSSSFGRSGKALNWSKVERSTDFNPLERWATWGRSQHERFNWIAGKENAFFGYQAVQAGGWPMFWKLWNLIRDVRSGRQKPSPDSRRQGSQGST
jgi:hypothetical protein